MTGDIMNRILYIKSEAVRRLIPKAEKILSGERLERFRALKRENDKLDSLAASALLEQALDGRIDLYYKDENGCPRLSNGKFLSISHSGGIAAVALSDREVGLDIQLPETRNLLSVARIAFHEHEIEILKKSHDIQSDFFKLWCLKESYMKARGLGFALPSKSFYFDLNEDKITLYSDDHEKWKFTLIEIEELYAAVCCQSHDNFSVQKLVLT